MEHKPIVARTWHRKAREDRVVHRLGDNHVFCWRSGKITLGLPQRYRIRRLAPIQSTSPYLVCVCCANLIKQISFFLCLLLWLSLFSVALQRCDNGDKFTIEIIHSVVRSNIELEYVGETPEEFSYMHLLGNNCSSEGEKEFISLFFSSSLRLVVIISHLRFTRVCTFRIISNWTPTEARSARARKEKLFTDPLCLLGFFYRRIKFPKHEIQNESRAAKNWNSSRKLWCMSSDFVGHGEQDEARISLSSQAEVEENVPFPDEGDSGFLGWWGRERERVRATQCRKVKRRWPKLSVAHIWNVKSCLSSQKVLFSLPFQCDNEWTNRQANTLSFFLPIVFDQLVCYL